MLFFLLAVGDWWGLGTVTEVAGWEGIFTGASAMYLAAAEIVNEAFERTVLPIGAPRPKARAVADERVLAA